MGMLDRTVVRAYAPAMGVWLAAALGQVALEQLQGEATASPSAALLRMAVLAALLGTLGLGGWVSVRLWRQR